MTTENTPETANEADTADEADTLLMSNAIRLSSRDWLIAATIILAVILVAPVVWSKSDPFEPIADFRIPYANSEDYWLYSRLINDSVENDRIVLIGDSVIWGEYVTPSKTLSHFMNEQEGSVRFVNGGVNATHPLALQGLVRDDADSLTDRRVILHCNLLWMSSPERDLQVDDDIPFNHPRLIPQFVPSIPAYKASFTERLGILVDRNVRFRSLVVHTRVDSFDSLDVPTWTLDYPYENPMDQIKLGTPVPSEALRHSSVSWKERGIEPQEFPWIDLQTSLQWQAFRDTVELLQTRNNRLFVIVGPFNEHLLTAENRLKFQRLKSGVREWLEHNDVEFIAPRLLPTADFADASHPLSRGYRQMADEVFTTEKFQQWLNQK